jgi:uncharacterized protein
MLELYQKYISPFYHALGKSFFGTSFACRFTPTCSEYTKLAIKKYGIIQGVLLGVRRILSCHPYSKRPTFDPVK